jgi:signal transduction histidine kinase
MEGYFFKVWELQGQLLFSRINDPPAIYDEENNKLVEMELVEENGEKRRPDSNLFLVFSKGKFYTLTRNGFREVRKGKKRGEFELINSTATPTDTLIGKGYFPNHIDIHGNIWYRNSRNLTDWAVIDTIRNLDRTQEVMGKMGNPTISELSTTQYFSLFKTGDRYFLWEKGNEYPMDFGPEMHRLGIPNLEIKAQNESNDRKEFAFGFRRGRLDLLYLKKDFFQNMTTANGRLNNDFMIGIYPFGKDHVIIRHDFTNPVYTLINRRTKNTEIIDTQKLERMIGVKPYTAYPLDLDRVDWVRQFGKKILDFPENSKGNNVWTLEYFIHDGKQYRYAVDFSLRLVRLEDGKVIFPKLTPISISSDGDLAWISTESEGLLSLHVPTGAIRQFLPQKNDPKSLPSERIYAAVPGASGYLWVATANGLAYLDKRLGEFTVMNTNHGLADNRIYSMAFDLEGDLWLGTGKGLSRLDTAVKTFTNYTQSDGLVNSEFNRNSAMLLEDGMMLMGGVNGLDYFYPSQVPKSVTPPKPILAMVRNNNRMVDITKPGDFSYDQDYLTFHLSAKPIWLAAEQTFQYRLVGVDDAWKDISNSNLVQYPTLRPGSYRFEFRIASQQETVSYEFTIHPPWYQTTWFRILVFLAIAMVIAVIARMVFVRKIARLAYENELIRLRAEKEKSLAKERERITADLHDDVGATLSSLQIYGELAGNLLDSEPEKGKEMISKIQEQSKELLFRMNDIVWSMKRPQDGNFTLSSRIKDFASQLLTDRGIHLHVEIGEELEAEIVQPDVRKNLLLIIKESLNNIAKHSKATAAILNIEQKRDMISMTIEDNGIGFDTNIATQGNGLGNLRKRAAELGGEIRIYSRENYGTAISLEFPIARISLD